MSYNTPHSVGALRYLVYPALIGAIIAFTYYFFELAVHESIHIVWLDIFNTDENQLSTAILCLVLAMVYFGVIEAFDKDSEDKVKQGMLNPSVRNYAIVLVVGFFSLFAGAPLGPEAVLIPACVIVAVHIYKHSDKAKLSAIVGFSALMTAFFSSLVFGLLGLFVALKQFGVKLSYDLFFRTLAALIATGITLSWLSGEAFLKTPASDFSLSPVDVLFAAILFTAGYAVVLLLAWLQGRFKKRYGKMLSSHWVIKALLAGGVLAGLYIVGGENVRFTGNESIPVVLSEASTIGSGGLILIALVKIVAVAWSRIAGYRGGTFFPLALVASTLVALIQLHIEFSYTVGLIALLAGAILANRRFDVLFS